MKIRCDSYKKNDILEVTEEFHGLAPITETGLENWRQLYRGDMIDDAGEIRLPPKEEWHAVAAGTRLIVVRARVHRGKMELVDPVSGIQFTAYRDDVWRAVKALR
jgi:hypothetical protein